MKEVRSNIVLTLLIEGDGDETWLHNREDKIEGRLWEKVAELRREFPLWVISAGLETRDIGK